MPSPDRHFANAAIFTHSTGLTPNAGDAALYIKSDNKAYIKDSAGTEAPVSGIGGSTGATDNLVLRADGIGGATVQNSAIQIDDATTSTQNNVAIINADSQTNSSLVLTPKGTGALIAGPKPDGTAVGGNARGAYAIDLQLGRSAATQVASNSYAVALGARSTASGNSSVCIGLDGVASGQGAVVLGGQFGGGNVASNTGSIAIGGFGQEARTGTYNSALGGQYNVASGSYSVTVGGERNGASASHSSTIGGLRALSNRYGMLSQAAGFFAADGDAQRARFVMRNKTTTNAAVELFLDGSTARLTIPSGKYLTGTINIAGIKSDGTAAASYIRQFSIKNVAGTTSLVGTVNTVGTDEAASTSISITANDTNDALKVEVTGITSETWRWVAAVDVVEVAYGA